MERSDSFSYWLRRRRKACDLTQQALADRAGCTAAMIRRIEADERRPSRELALRLADVLAVAPAERAAFLQAARGEGRADQLQLDEASRIPTFRSVPPASRHNLPVAPNTLIGREPEIASVCALLRTPHHRLVTLTGPGGIGKTRLALQVAYTLVEDYPDGVWFVDLAPVRSRALVLPTITRALGLSDNRQGDVFEHLVAYLHHKRLLLVLDNLEQVLSGAPELARLLAALSGLQLLATSRSALRLRAEQEYLVPPLALPAAVGSNSLEQLGQVDAVALLLSRARAVRPDFALTPENVAAVVAVCERLDGMPLAIELAAARLKVLTPAMMLAQLDNRLALLVGGSRDSPLRQQSLRATLDWSYQLLSPAAQMLFARLGTFAGSWTLEAATAVASDEELEPTSLLALHESLVDMSMIQIVSQPVGELRFSMLETLREYARMQLRDRPEVQALRERYLKYFLDLARRGGSALRTAEAREWMDRLDADYSNLRLVLEWSQSKSELEIGLDLAGALHEFWIMRGRRHEVYVWLREQLRVPYPGSWTEVRGKALLAAAAIAASYGDSASAEVFAAEALIIAEQRDIQSLRAWTLLQMGENASNAGEFVKGLALLEDSLREFDILGDLHGKARALHAIGYCYRDRPPAEQYYRESLALAREVQNESISAGAVTKLGELSAEYGRFDLAEAQIREGLALARKLGHVHQTTIAQYALAKLMLARGDLEQAEELYIASYELALRQNTIGTAVLSLGGLGRIAFWRGDPQGARQHHLACLTLLGDRYPTFRPRFTAMLGKLAEATGDLAQAAAYHKESLRLYHAIEDQIGVAWAQSNLGRLQLQAGNVEASAELLGASLERFLQTGGENYSRKYPAVISCLSNVAELAEQQREVARAALLWGASEALQECHPPNPLLYESQPGDALRISDARARLARGAHASHWRDGRTLSFDETLHQALYVVLSLAGRR